MDKSSRTPPSQRDLRRDLNAALAADAMEIRGKVTPEYAEILTPAALRFVASLCNQFEGVRQQLMEARERRQEEMRGTTIHTIMPCFSFELSNFFYRWETT